MGRPSNTEARRAEIVEGLRVVLAREGYERATVAAVAKVQDRVLGVLLAQAAEPRHALA